mmetsp:Transcript_17454/g.54921  ORF Transcript_17454/g.54921 Transcript_17454/m.54921 type:complete len:244 (+) Transcript_17454:527-1258(+)
MASSVIKLGVDPGSRHSSPPQPAHVPRYSEHISLVWRSLQRNCLGRHLFPSQPADGMLSHVWEFSQIDWSVILLGDASLPKQLLPPQPAHCIPSLAEASSHRWGQVMSPQSLSRVRQRLPPQPIEEMPRSLYDSAQMAASVMRKAGALGGKHMLPPQPAHDTPRSILASSHVSRSVISKQLSACTKREFRCSTADLVLAFRIMCPAASSADAKRAMPTEVRPTILLSTGRRGGVASSVQYRIA